MILSGAYLDRFLQHLGVISAFKLVRPEKEVHDNDLECGIEKGRPKVIDFFASKVKDYPLFLNLYNKELRRSYLYTFFHVQHCFHFNIFGCSRVDKIYVFHVNDTCARKRT